MSDPKPLLVGEDNPYGSDPRYALFPEPPNSAGGRLCRCVLGLSRRGYMRHFDRVNLCREKWSTHEARVTAVRLMRESPVRKFVLLGAKVAKAFGLPYEPFTVRGSMPSDDQLFILLPHPSGRSRAWNEPDSYGRAQALLRGTGVLPICLEGAEVEPTSTEPESEAEQRALAGNCSCSYRGCPHDAFLEKR